MNQVIERRVIPERVPRNYDGDQCEVGGIHETSAETSADEVILHTFLKSK